jgi:hypothetical protein
MITCFEGLCISPLEGQLVVNGIHFLLFQLIHFV